MVIIANVLLLKDIIGYILNGADVRYDIRLNENFYFILQFSLQSGIPTPEPLPIPACTVKTNSSGVFGTRAVLFQLHFIPHCKYLKQQVRSDDANASIKAAASP